MPAIDLNAEQLQLVKIVNDRALRFPFNESADAAVLQTCYDYLGAFNRVMDSTSSIQIDICQQYNGFYQFAKLMEMLARGFADGTFYIPKDH